MKRQILEAVFPGAAGMYSEGGDEFCWWAGFTEGHDVQQVNFINDLVYAETLINNNHNYVPIPIKAIHLISQYENQPK
jgi:hypothetical protein